MELADQPGLFLALLSWELKEVDRVNSLYDIEYDFVEGKYEQCPSRNIIGTNNLRYIIGINVIYQLWIQILFVF